MTSSGLFANFMQRLVDLGLAPKSAMKNLTGHIPVAGEQWVFDVSDDYPFETGPGHIVTIRDVADGWVRYDYRWRKDQRLKLDSFMAMYKPMAKD